MKRRAVVVEALVHVRAVLQMLLQQLYLPIAGSCIKGHNKTKQQLVTP